MKLPATKDDVVFGVILTAALVIIGALIWEAGRSLRALEKMGPPPVPSPAESGRP